MKYQREYVEEETLFNLMLKIDSDYNTWKVVNVFYNNVKYEYVAILEKEKK